MDLSHIKMVVTDMDGTLLNSQHQVSARFFELFQKLKGKNIAFVAASGRQYNSIIDKLQPIKDDIIVIAENGALAKNKEKELLVTPIHQNQIDDLLEKIKGIDGAHAMLCGKYMSYFEGKSKSFLNQLKEYYSSFEVLDNFGHVTEEILKIAVYHPEDAESFVYPTLRPMENDVKVKVSGMNWVDLNHKNANKGNALKYVMEEVGVTNEEVLVFGDYNNDIEMLSLSTYSFAMANAHPNVKKVAQFETSSNNDFGVERILETLTS